MDWLWIILCCIGACFLVDELSAYLKERRTQVDRVIEELRKLNHGENR